MDVVSYPVTYLSDLVISTESHMYIKEFNNYPLSNYSAIISQPDKDNNHLGLVCYFKHKKASRCKQTYVRIE